MNKILFNVLVVGVSLTGTQGTFAGKPGLHSPVERSSEEVKTTPIKLINSHKSNSQEKRIPLAPTKKSARHFVEARIKQSPDVYNMSGNTLWKKDEGGVILNPVATVFIKPVPICPMIKISLEGSKLFFINENNQKLPCRLGKETLLTAGKNNLGRNNSFAKIYLINKK